MFKLSRIEHTFISNSIVATLIAVACWWGVGSVTWSVAMFFAVWCMGLAWIWRSPARDSKGRFTTKWFILIATLTCMGCQASTKVEPGATRLSREVRTDAGFQLETDVTTILIVPP